METLEGMKRISINRKNIEEHTAKEIVMFVEAGYNKDLSHISIKNKRRIVKEALEIIENTDLTESWNEAKSDPLLEKGIFLSNFNRAGIIEAVKEDHNKNIGGLFKSTKKIRRQAKKLYEDAGWLVD